MEVLLTLLSYFTFLVSLSNRTEATKKTCCIEVKNFGVFIVIFSAISAQSNRVLARIGYSAGTKKF